jgi:hypothetical protein
MSNIVNLEDARVARIDRKAAEFFLKLVREPAGGWTLMDTTCEKPEVEGMTLNAVEGYVDHIIGQKAVTEDELLMGR